MPHTTIVRPVGAPPRVGERYGFTDGGRAFVGTVTRIAPMRKAKYHVAVTVELSEEEHKRLMLEEQ